MSKKFVVLNKKTHKSFKYKNLRNYDFFTERTTVPLLPFEAPNAAFYFPIIFPDKKSCVPHVMLGLENKNVYVDKKNGWKVPYVPLLIANYPFSLVKINVAKDADVSEKNIDFALAIDENAPHFHQSDGVPLFDDDGNPSELLQKISTTIFSQYRSQIALSSALNELTLRNVLEKESVTVEYDGKKKAVAGLRCVSKKKVYDLADDVLATWIRNGVMEVIYSHWQSMRNLRFLLDNISS